MATTGNAQTVGVAASGQGSFTYGAASAIAKVVSENTDLQMRVQPTGGSNIWVPQLNAQAKDFGMLATYETWLANRGRLIYKKKHENLRAVSVMAPLTPGLFVRKDSPYKKIGDLKGARVSSGFTTQKVIAEVIKGHLANAGLTYDDVKKVPAPNVVRAAGDFAQGKTDALFFALGSGKILQASAKVGGVRFLSLDPSPEAWKRLQGVIPMAYQMHVKPAKRFHGVTAPSTAMAYDLLIITHANQSADVVYKVTKAMHGNKKDMAAVFPVLKQFSQKKMAKKGPLSYHPGAIKFYREKGLWPPKN
ncbi:MAG: TAXI family TRAP transporter solute-binding subunit [Rhodospirillales bacterium]|nr:TAXI family TRAP transporter solute-binding subunit [Rhodospirillales bacterium]